MSEEESAVTLAELDHLRSRVRRDRRETSVPLILLGVLAVMSAVPLPLDGPLTLLATAVIAVFVVAAYYRKRQVTTGIGTAYGQWVKAALAVLVVGLMGPGLLMLFLPPVAVIGAVVAILGWRRSNRTLLLAGLVTTAVTGLEQWFIVSNRFWDFARLMGSDPQSWWVLHAQQLVVLFLGAGLLVTAATIRRWERSNG